MLLESGRSFLFSLLHRLGIFYFLFFLSMFFLRDGRSGWKLHFVGALEFLLLFDLLIGRMLV